MSSKRQNKLLNYFDVTTPRQSTEESTTSTAEGDVGLEHSSVLTESDSESEGEDTTPSAASETPTCECMCCSDRNNAHQPTNVVESKVSHAYSSKTGHKKKHSRAIQTSWYKSYPWITVCTSRYMIFCVSCRSANGQGLLTFSKRSNLAFVQDGFSNWKKALQTFQEHEASSMHREAALKLAAKSSGVRVDTQLSTQLKLDQEHHRRMFLKVLHCIQFLSRQGLPLRGHKEDEEHFGGNLYQLLLLQAKSCPELLTWLRQKDYISPEIVNEVIQIMGQSVLRKIAIGRHTCFVVVLDNSG